MPQSTRKDRSVQTLVIDKSALVRAGLIHVLAGTRYRVTAWCSTLDDLPPNPWNGHQCLALIGLDEGAVDVLSRVAALKAEHEGLRVIMLSDRLDPEEMLAAIRSGGDGYLLKKEISPDVLLKSLDLILLGEAIIPQEFARLIRGRARLQPDGPNVEDCAVSSLDLEHLTERTAPEATEIDETRPLSSREHTILCHLTGGASNKHIARELNISEATVKVHVKSLLRKINAKNRTQAAMWAVTHLGACRADAAADPVVTRP